MRISDITATGSFTSSPVLVTINDDPFGGNFSEKSSIYAASIPSYNNTYQYGYGTLTKGFMIGGISIIRWTDITITNVSNIPLFIDASHGLSPYRAFTYNGKMYYGIKIISKYKPVRFMLLRVPNYQLEYGNGIAFNLHDKIIQVEGNGLIESNINHFDGKTYSILQI